jgi:hypothetical protein
MNMVYERKLFRVKYYNKTYYRKLDSYWHPRFEELKWFGVEVTRWKYIPKVIDPAMDVPADINDEYTIRHTYEFDGDYVDSDFLDDDDGECIHYAN